MLSRLFDDAVTVFGTVQFGGASQSLSGDVTGPPSSNTVHRIHNFPVDMAIRAGDGTVLGFDVGGWHLTTLPTVPQPATIQTPPGVEQLGGFGDLGVKLEYARADHIHPLPVNQFQGQFVEHSTNQRYLIVAAGLFRAEDGKQVGEVYNGLTVEVQAGGAGYLLNFGGQAGDPSQRYVNPDPTNPTPRPFTYIVKGTVFNTKGPGYFYVISFQQKGILVQVVRGNSDIPVEFFMVEISLYGKF